MVKVLLIKQDSTYKIIDKSEKINMFEYDTEYVNGFQKYPNLLLIVKLFGMNK